MIFKKTKKNSNLSEGNTNNENTAQALKIKLRKTCQKHSHYCKPFCQQNYG